ncbi:MAG: lipoyl synthase [Eubacteriales bacterium]
MRRPDWLKVSINGSKTHEVNETLRTLHLNTVCEEANCPNRIECYGKKTATFMILGKNCTRNCTFCNVDKNVPSQVDSKEPDHIAQAVKSMGMKHVVVTSVTRDDLKDGGAGHFAEVVEAIKRDNQGVTIEVLIPDFRGSENSLRRVAIAQPEIINHNLETINRLYSRVRPMANYNQSLQVLYNTKKINAKIITKSGIMLGLGEEYQEVIQLMEDIRSVDCDILTIGQYLAPSSKHHPVIEYVHPDMFNQYKEEALKLGFKYVASAPLVRSSYNAYEAMEVIMKD